MVRAVLCIVAFTWMLGYQAYDYRRRKLRGEPLRSVYVNLAFIAFAAVLVGIDYT